MSPGPTYAPCTSITSTRAGTGQSPRAPAHAMRPPRTRTTASRTGARPGFTSVAPTSATGGGDAPIRKTERRAQRDLPPLRRLHEDPLGDPFDRHPALRRRITHPVVIRAVHHARRDRDHPQVARDQRVRPGAVAPRRPVLEALLESARPVPRRRLGREVVREVARAVVLVDRIHVPLEHLPRRRRVALRRALGARVRRGESKSEPDARDRSDGTHGALLREGEGKCSPRRVTRPVTAPERRPPRRHLAGRVSSLANPEP